MGFRTIVNIRTEQEGAPDEGVVVKAQGLAFVWVPVTSGTFSLEDVEAVEKVLDDPEAAPVLLHCASGNRVAAVWASHPGPGRPHPGGGRGRRPRRRGSTARRCGRPFSGS